MTRESRAPGSLAHVSLRLYDTATREVRAFVTRSWTGIRSRISATWLTTPTTRDSSFSVRSRTSTPSMVTRPELTSLSRLTSEASVDLPEPVSPTSASVLPAGTVRSTSDSAGRPLSS